jgi:hypothetical protein
VTGVQTCALPILEHLLARAGFKIEALYSSFDQDPVGAVVPGEQIVVATAE